MRRGMREACFSHSLTHLFLLSYHLSFILLVSVLRTGVRLEALRVVNLQHCSVGTFGEVVDQIVYLLRRCQNLGASNRTPVRKTDTSRINDRW